MPQSEQNSPQTPLVPVASNSLGTLQEELKHLLQLATTACDVPIGVVSLLNEEGNAVAVSTSPAGIEALVYSPFCAHAILQGKLFVAPDLREAPAFSDSACVTADPFLRFYAGSPILSSDNSALGSLCIFDFAPRQLTTMQQKALGAVARQIAAWLDLNKQTAILRAAVEELNRTAKEMEISGSRFRALLDASPVAAFMKEEDGRMIYCNQALTEPFGVVPEDWIGKTDFQTLPQEIAEKFRTIDLQVLDQNRAIHFQDHTLGADGHTISWDVYKFPIVDASGTRSLACMSRDVTNIREAQEEVQKVQLELQVANEKLHTLSLTDALTGLMNRRALEDSLERELARCIRSRAQLCLLMFDVDHFKSFNDTFGHVQGDEALRRISDLLRKWTRKGDLVARYGGEEFLAILPDTGPVEAIQIAQRLCEGVADAPWEHRAITASIGVATLDGRKLSTTDFLNEADQALYAAKRRGRNQVCAAQRSPENSISFITPNRAKDGTP